MGQVRREIDALGYLVLFILLLVLAVNFFSVAQSSGKLSKKLYNQKKECEA